MAFNPKDYKRFLNKFRPGGEYSKIPFEFDEEDKKLLESLVKEYQKLDKSKDEYINVDVKALVKDLEDRRKLLDSYKDQHADNQHYSSISMRMMKQQRGMLERVLLAKLEAGDINKETRKILVKQIKQLDKNIAQLKNNERSIQKGAAVANQMLQMTIGLTSYYDGSGGRTIIGNVKGVAKQLKKSITLTNLITTSLSKAVDAILSADKAAETAFKKGGFDNYFKTVQSSMSAGANGILFAESKLAEMDVSLLSGVRKIDREDMLKDSYRKNVVFGTKLKDIGVGAQDIVKINSVMVGAFNANAEQTLQSQKFVYAVSQQTGRGVRETFKDAAALMPVYVKYGRQGGQEMFRRMAHAAKRANVDVKDLMSLTERFDQSEDALEQAARFNALLGGQYLNGVELLRADPDQKVKLIADAYQKAEGELGSVDRNVKREIMANFQMKGDQFMNMVTGKFDDFDAKVTKKTPDPKKVAKINIDKDLDQAYKFSERMQAQMQKAGRNLIDIEKLKEKLPVYMQKVKTFIRNMDKWLPAIVAGIAAWKAAELFASRYGITKPYKVIDIMGGRGPGGGSGPKKPKKGPKGPKKPSMMDKFKRATIGKAGIGALSNRTMQGNLPKGLSASDFSKTGYEVISNKTGKRLYGNAAKTALIAGTASIPDMDNQYAFNKKVDKMHGKKLAFFHGGAFKTTGAMEVRKGGIDRSYVLKYLQQPKLTPSQISKMSGDQIESLLKSGHLFDNRSNRALKKRIRKLPYGQLGPAGSFIKKNYPGSSGSRRRSRRKKRRFKRSSFLGKLESDVRRAKRDFRYFKARQKRKARRVGRKTRRKVDSIKKTVTGKVTSVRDRIGSFFSGVGQSVSSGLSRAGRSISSTVSSATSYVKSTRLYKGTRELGRGLYEVAQGKHGGVMGALRGTARESKGVIKGYYKTVAERAAAVKNFVVDKTSAAWKSTVDTISAGVQKFKSFARKHITEPLVKFMKKHGIDDAVKKAKDGIVKGAKSFGATLLKVAGRVLGPALTAFFAHQEIKNAILSGAQGEELHNIVGGAFLKFLGGTVTGIAATALMDGVLAAITVGTGGMGAAVTIGLRFALQTIIYLIGDAAGRFMVENVLMPLFPSLAPFVGRQLMKLPMYKNLHAKLMAEQGKQAPPDIKVVGLPGSGNSSSMEDLNIQNETRPGAFQKQYDDTSGGAVSPAPVKKMEYERSKQDGLLLEKIHTIKTKILETASLERKISLNVDGRIIGEAAL